MAEDVGLRNEFTLLQEEHRKLQDHLSDVEKKYQSRLAELTGFDNGEDRIASRLQTMVTDLFNKQIYSDVIILLKGGHQLNGHKLILAARSDDWGDLHHVSRLDLTDIRYEVAYAIIKWVYTEEFNNKMEDILLMEMLRATIKFRLEYLHLRCQKSLISRININNCNKFYQTSEETSAELLRDCCLKFFSQYSVQQYPSAETTDDYSAATFDRQCIIDHNVYVDKNYQVEINRNSCISDNWNKDAAITLHNQQYENQQQIVAFEPYPSGFTQIAAVTTPVYNNPSHRSYTNKEKTHRCDFCSTMFVSAKNLRNHQRIHSGEKPYKCDTCGKMFRQRGVLRRHVRIHTGDRPYRCNVCTKTFSQNSHLLQHIKIHTGDKKFKCNFCEKTFIERSPLRLHMLTHTKEKPHVCEICTKTFSRKSSLQDHVMKHSGQKPFKCETCDKEFYKKTVLHKHMLSHSDDRPYKCDTCDKAFSARCYLKNHLKTHVDSRLFVCSRCNKGFNRKGTLQTHEMIHTGDRPHACDRCDKTFIKKSALVRHYRTHTKGDTELHNVIQK